MLDTILLLGTFGVVEAIQCSYQIAGDASDALEGRGTKIVIQLNLIVTNLDIDMSGLNAVFLCGTGDIGVDFILLCRL